MANPNISLLGATYNGVTGVTLPKSGGGTATFPWVEGSQTITTNNTYDVTNLAQVIVNVAGGGGSGLTYETGTWTPTSDIARGEISFANTHSEAPILIALSDATGTANTVTNSNMSFVFFDPYKAFGAGFPYNSTGLRYAFNFYGYRGTSTGSISGSVFMCSKNSDNTGSSDTSYPRYWASPTKFYPYSNSTSRYWRSGRTYKWYAVWK